MIVQDWLINAEKELEKADISTARLDCLVLLEDVTGKNRAWLLAHPEFVVNDRATNMLERHIKRRAGHEPLAYIRGKSEFYGHVFLVNKHTLVPRPETETMLELFAKLYKSQKPPLKKDGPFTERENVIWGVTDVGTGSGAIGISLKLEYPELDVYCTDISNECLKIAEQNQKILGADVKLFQGNLLEPMLSAKHYPINAVLANLPYVSDSHTINQAAMHEPKIAIFGGDDGLNIYKELFDQITKYKLNPSYVFTESMPFQHKSLAQIAKQSGYKIFKTDDFIQVFKNI